jgi:hypothetical protein
MEKHVSQNLAVAQPRASNSFKVALCYEFTRRVAIVAVEDKHWEV